MRRFSARSVRFQIAAMAMFIVVVLLASVGLALLIVQQRMLTAALDDGLRRRADDLAVVIGETIPESLPGSDDDDAAQLVATDGSVIVSSPNVAAMGPLAPDPAGVEVIAERDLVEPDDSFRVLSRSVMSPEGRLILHLATASDDVSDSVAVLRNSLLVAIPLAVALLGLAIWWLVGRALEPVAAMTREVTAITETDLDKRVPVPAADDEISQLALTMNLMLDRLEDGVSRLQRFVADASHELRSPLTRIRSELEVDLAHPGGSDLAATHRSVLDETVSLQRLVDDLLYLARTDAGKARIHDEPVDLDDLVMSEVERLRSSGLAIDASKVSAGQVVGDRIQLARAVRNLIDNAARHAATKVILELGEAGPSVLLAISDDGPGIPQEDLERVFERFARADEGRSRVEGGSGLGLAIVRDVIERHGGTVAVDREYRAGARLVVRLPRAN
jgi:signal transduction histidine kinase